MWAKIHRLKITRACCGLRVAGKRGRILKNRGKKTKQKFFTSQLATRNSQPFPPGSKKLAVDLGTGNPPFFYSQPMLNTLTMMFLLLFFVEKSSFI
jgi:hypothetical protein